MAIDTPTKADPPAQSGPLPVRTFQATRSRLQLSEIWTTWRVARIVGVRDMRIKYKQSILGPVWLVLQPLGMLVAVSVAFTGVTKVDTAGIPYVLFALIGIAVWAYTQQTIATAASTMPSNTTLVRRSSCPRVALVNGALLANLPTLMVMTLLSLVVAIVLNGAQWPMVTIPLMVAWLLVFIWGPAMLLSSIASRFRDAIAVVPLLLQTGLFLSPVGYPIASTNGTLRLLISLNPLSGLIEAWRWAMLGVDPLVLPLVAAAVWTAVLGVTGWWVFGRLETQFADYL